jgi:serine/threonine protein kinase
VVNKSSSRNDEAELLFLLGSLRHRNIVELITFYSQNGLTNLLFPKADLDLHQFLLLRCRPSAFQDDATLFQSLHGLSSGLAYLHNFNPRSTSSEDPTTPTLYGYHHDIKPRNILVQGTDFVLADFGVSRVKTESEITQTSWKDSTYEYGAPECRDPNTFRPGMVGRALDIWSLACIFSEIMVYIEGGSKGIERFRDCRLLDNVHGKTRCFHNNNALAPAVDLHLKNIESHSSSTAICTLGTVIRSMFASEPESRPKAKEVVEQMIHVTLESLTSTLLQTAEDSYQVLNSSGVTDLFGTRLSLEKTRLEAWAAVLGLIPVQGSRRPNDKQTVHIFPEACSTLSSAIKELRDRPDFDDVYRDQDFIISSFHHTNNNIYGLLNRSLRLSVDGTFAILGTYTKSLESLQLIAPATKGNLSKSGDIAAISVMKYMSILLQQQDPGSLHGTRIESTLVKQDSSSVDPKMSPQTYWYSFGYLDTEKRRVLVEYKAFDTLWAKDPNATSFKELGEKVFSQIQGLVNMLQREPKPADFRVLKCLGAFPDIANCRFGFVYSYPYEDRTPIRLHSLLRRQRSQIPPPGLSERLALATVLVSSVHSFHASGWLHKNINSYNILFFCQSLVPLVDLNLENPYTVGFNHSRTDSPSAYTEGPVDTTFQDYQHPSYRSGGIRYEKYFDIYSLGLLLLEIGLWSSMGDISHM